MRKPGKPAGRRERPEKSTFRKEKPAYGREKTEHPPQGEFSKERSKEYHYDRPERREKKEEDRRFDGSAERKKPSYTLRKPEKRKIPLSKEIVAPGLIRLNKYIADAGICSRREADQLITAGVIKVNGKVVTTLGTKVSPEDKVQYGDQSLNREKLRYVLLNKPKGFITTTDDPQERKTVMSLIAKACKERIYPVGRLDRNTTGLLLFTNDGELAKKLSHPKHGIRKIYHVVLDKPLTKKEMLMITEGIELEDGIIKVDAIEYIGDGKDKKQIGIELHSGKNRIVRRIFEKLEYKVVRLDRVAFAGLTKKTLPRGEWRHLEEKEVSFLKMLS